MSAMAHEEVSGERDARVAALLEDNVGTELQVVNGMLELGISSANIERLMEGVTSGLLYAANVEWSPDWVKPGQVHTPDRRTARSSPEVLCASSTLRPLRKVRWRRRRRASMRYRTNDNVRFCGRWCAPSWPAAITSPRRPRPRRPGTGLRS